VRFLYKCKHFFHSNYVKTLISLYLYENFIYLESQRAAQFRENSFPFYNEFSSIYGKDLATGRDAQIREDIIEEMANEEGIGGINLASENEDVSD